MGEHPLSSFLQSHTRSTTDEDVRTFWLVSSLLWQLAGQQWHRWTHTTYLADMSYQ